MDVVIEKKKKSIPQSLLIATSGLVAVVIWLMFQPSASEAVERDSLVFDSVKRGDFEVTVRGFGRLRSKKQTMLATRDSATVEEIVLRPGALVDTGTVIARLSNPALEQQATDSQVAWQQQKSSARQQNLNNARELLSAESNIADVKSEHAVVKQRLEAFDLLAKKGVVSVLDHQAEKLNEAQLKAKLSIETKRLAQLRQLHQESEKIQQELIDQKEQQYLSVVKRLDELTVRAPNKGVLQRMPIELGQSLDRGEQVALIGSLEELVGLIKVAQREVTNVAIGQFARLVIDGIEVDATVIRVDPAVQDNGMVLVEVELTGAKELNGALPPSAKPERMVDATIITASLKDVFYLKRPNSGRKNAKSFLYKHVDKGKLERSSVVFGDVSVDTIQLVSGVKEGDVFVLSDMSNYDGMQSIVVR